jgi:hypothetical protein
MTDRTRRQFVAGLTISGSSIALTGCTGDDSTTETGGSSGDQMTEASVTEAEMNGESMTETESMDGESMTEGRMESTRSPTDPGDAPRVPVDRFSDAAGTLHRRSANGELPGPDKPINFDENFLTQGYGPGGTVIQYYDFDITSTTPAPIYALFYENGDPVEDQLNVVDVVPGDDGYNDFWHVHKVTVPDDYEANSVTSLADIQSAGFEISPTDVIKNCPVVPEGSTASMRHSADGSPAETVEGWYDGEVVSYFLFEETSLTAQDGSVPVSPIFVTFDTNPGQDGGGPASGFMTEDGSAQTHNVTATLPGDDAYSPLWSVNVYDNADFDSVEDLDRASSATILASGEVTVNCPVVSEQ